MRKHRYLLAGIVFALFVWMTSSSAQTARDVAPDIFLPQGNVRTSLPGAIRIYKMNALGQIAAQPSGFPKTVKDPTKPFDMADDEMPRIHEGFDLSSRGKDGKPESLEFRAGVYGKVVSAKKGMIGVEVDDTGDVVEYLHNSSVAPGIKPGVQVTPLTVLGKTGNINPSTGDVLNGMAIHLHVQARNRKNQALNPDEVVAYARKPLKERGKPDPLFVPMKWADWKALKPIDWSQVREDFVDRATPQNYTPRLVIDESQPKRKRK